MLIAVKSLGKILGALLLERVKLDAFALLPKKRSCCTLWWTCYYCCDFYSLFYACECDDVFDSDVWCININIFVSLHLFSSLHLLQDTK